MGWSNPAVIAGLAGGAVLLAVFAAIERRVAEPLFQLRLFKIRAFTAGNLAQHGALSSLTPANRDLLTGREFFPHLISGPFHDGLVLVFAVSAALGLIAAVVSLMRGGKPSAETGASVSPAAEVRS